jgi:uncharacterized protein (TIGR03435 family)
MAFEVASIKPGRGGALPLFPLDAGDAYAPTGGRFFANFPLWAYIQFAYKIWPTEQQRREALAHLPEWAAESFTIEAQAEGNPTKDQMRLMMQSLLADRFKLAVHFETRVVPVFALTLVNPGKLGPKLRPHAEGPPCDNAGWRQPAPRIASDADVFPPVCDAFMMRSRASTLVGSRNTTMALLAGALPSLGSLSRPVVDQTGMSGRFDFTIEWLFESAVVAPFRAEPDLPGPAFLDALREQLGLKLESMTGPVQILVIDSVDKPSEN